MLDRKLTECPAPRIRAADMEERGVSPRSVLVYYAGARDPRLIKPRSCPTDGSTLISCSRTSLKVKWNHLYRGQGRLAGRDALMREAHCQEQ